MNTEEFGLDSQHNRTKSDIRGSSKYIKKIDVTVKTDKKLSTKYISEDNLENNYETIKTNRTNKSKNKDLSYITYNTNNLNKINYRNPQIDLINKNISILTNNSNFKINNEKNGNINLDNLYDDNSNDLRIIDSERQMVNLNKILKGSKCIISNEDLLRKITNKTFHKNSISTFTHNESLKTKFSLSSLTDEIKLKNFNRTNINLFDKIDEENESKFVKCFKIFVDKKEDTIKEKINKKHNEHLELIKRKEHKLDEIFNKQMNYEEIVQENIDELKLKFCKKNVISEVEKEKFKTFYGTIKKHIRNSLSTSTNLNTNDFKVKLEFSSSPIRLINKIGNNDRINSLLAKSSDKTRNCGDLSNIKMKFPLTNMNVKLIDKDEKKFDNWEKIFDSKKEDELYIPKFIEKKLFNSPRKDRYSYK